jgi:hypothetical protein
MSDVTRHGLPKQAAIVDIYDRTEDQFGRLSIVHPAHPMRKAQTIKVGSLREMINPIVVSVPFVDLIDDTTAFDYAIFDWTSNKPELRVIFADSYNFVYRIASTINVPEDSKIANGVSDAIKGLLLRRLDAVEAIIWFSLFLNRAVWVPFNNEPKSYREIFALSRALLSRMMPSDAYDVMLSPKSYGAALLENSIGSGNNTNYAEPQVASGSLTLIPVASNGFTLSSFDLLCVYPSKLPSLCKRYIYETFADERVIDRSEDRNTYRMTAERYVLISLPTDYSWSVDYYVAPIVGMRTNGALDNIRNTFGVNTLGNLELVSSIS